MISVVFNKNLSKANIYLEKLLKKLDILYVQNTPSL